VVLAQRQQLVAQRQQAAWLEAEDRHAARREWRVGLYQTVEFGAGLIDQTGGEKGSSAAERAAPAHRLWYVHAIAAFDQHAQGGIEILALVIPIESIGEQHDLAAIRGAKGLRIDAKRIAPERGQRPFGADACEFLEQRAQHRAVVARIRQPRNARGEGSVMREITDQTI